MLVKFRICYLKKLMIISEITTNLPRKFVKFSLNVIFAGD